MIRGKSAFVLGALVLIQWSVILAMKLIRFSRVKVIAEKCVKTLPALEAEMAIICIRRMRYFPSTCLAWATVAGAYIKHTGQPCDVTFSANRTNKGLTAHAYLKFPDGSTIGGTAGLIELS